MLKNGVYEFGGDDADEGLRALAEQSGVPLEILQAAQNKYKKKKATVAKTLEDSTYSIEENNITEEQRKK